MKTQVNPVPPPENGRIRWSRPIRVDHDWYSVQEYGPKGWEHIVHHDRAHAREMCRNANLAHQLWFQRRAEIARRIEAEKQAVPAQKEEVEKYKARMKMLEQAAKQAPRR